MNEITNTYPASLSIDYPKKLNRLTTFFRIFMVIPIYFLLIFLTGGVFNISDYMEQGKDIIISTGGFVMIPTILMILIRQKYPKWWFDWNLALLKFSNRVTAYALLLRDEYPSTDEDQAIHIDIKYPDVKNELNRWLPLVKWFLALPHMIVLFFLFLAVIICTIISWVIILFTGNYPKSIFDFVVGVGRWSLRVYVYAFMLTTDQYPPSSLS